MSARVITFASGKGGTGKTTVCIATAALLSADGKSVQMIDGDVATHGLSHFFDGYRGRSTAARLEGSTIAQAVALGDKTSIVTSMPVDTADSPEALTTMAVALRQAVSDGLEKNEYILIDCQAGTSVILNAALKVSDDVIVVTEADPVSVAAVQSLVGEVRSQYSGPLWGMVNRIYEDEKPYYAALSDYLRGVRFIGMLPFDRDARRAFFRRESPVQGDRSSPFALALATSLTRVGLPVAALTMDDSEGLPSLSKSKSDVEELEQLRDEAEFAFLMARYGVRRKRIVQMLAIYLGIVSLSAALALTDFQILTRNVGIALIAAAALFTFGAVGQYIIARMNPRDHYDLEQSRKTLWRIEERLSEFSVADSNSDLVNGKRSRWTRIPHPTSPAADR